ncbi:MAG TPA: N-glycosylase/DNA lyase [Candidatus Ratteibacteria bacterium]|jgi:N-glycosylase/DNA lyase|uniref:8-oxoguanine DNA glycosylase/AP lyase n=1 Tax=candidate division TA06 bacterium ADurb.Bin131 TaxID=1852827 RepID=A0A1V6C4V6_UNCT6|nr:MAG: putative N-glycosylase/DNA lyase [candidate division TA06 bacterium ADurb.Bin131]HON04762.1 N-glycosylase/DNA lyase [bacterium]HPC30228.1 N-glycosylase/DNA lyase [bacterium]HRS05763.1 N-glycosylase/DNA lyase [Candidatus Ratteibacteria bacterium]HRV03440.1 N-glycosylase/DNA lyase [Candidatus Ratteibacteria bacterium]
MTENEIQEIFNVYNRIKPEIEEKIRWFTKTGIELNRTKILNEICFCILTPQSRAEVCWRCIEELNKSKILYSGTKKQIQKYLKGVRFYRTKAESIIMARSSLQKVINILKKEKDPLKIRQYLVKNIRGFGMKEATHFLRNIGKSDNLAILDRHILRKLQRIKVIQEIPTSVSVKKYQEIEKNMQRFANRIQIPVSHLDFIFWYQETGRIFK